MPFVKRLQKGKEARKPIKPWEYERASTAQLEVGYRLLLRLQKSSMFPRFLSTALIWDSEGIYADFGVFISRIAASSAARLAIDSLQSGYRLPISMPKLTSTETLWPEFYIRAEWVWTNRIPWTPPPDSEKHLFTSMRSDKRAARAKKMALIKLPPKPDPREDIPAKTKDHANKDQGQLAISIRKREALLSFTNTKKDYFSGREEGLFRRPFDHPYQNGRAMLPLSYLAPFMWAGGRPQRLLGRIGDTEVIVPQPDEILRYASVTDLKRMSETNKYGKDEDVGHSEGRHYVSQLDLLW